MSFHYVDFQAFCLATEDEQKVKQCIINVVGDPLVELKEEVVEGYHKNPITIFSYRMQRNVDIKMFFAQLQRAGALKPILDQMEIRLDEDLFLNFRLNKQDAIKERLILAVDASRGGVVSVRAKVKAFPTKRERAIEVIAEYMEGLD
jgi:RNA binding exosome subunit